jgi:hypothetical protein
MSVTVYIGLGRSWCSLVANIKWESKGDNELLAVHRISTTFP